MQTNKILSSNLLDIIFDERNKDYGAYELRVTYPKRIKRSLMITSAIGLLLVLGTAWASSKKNTHGLRQKISEVSLTEIKPEEKIEPPKPIEKPPQPQVELIAFKTPVITPDELVDDPPPQIADLDSGRISDIDRKGTPDTFIPEDTPPDDGKGIIPKKPMEDEDRIESWVHVEASFPGGEAKWRRYLEQNCNGQVANDNGAPEGRYAVMVQFVVDKEGNISDVRALTNHGYGMEEEAVRVIRKGPNWNAAFQNGVKVKAYRKQPITFQVSGE